MVRRRLGPRGGQGERSSTAMIGDRYNSRATVAAFTEVAPAPMSASAHAASVDPVVITSSIRTKI